jgi:hypothetical protein
VAPVINIREYTENVQNARTKHSDLDITAKSAAELEAKLSPASRFKLESAVNILTKGLAVGAAVAGVFLIYVVTKNVYEGITAAVNRRNGCFVTQKINGQLVSCKLVSRSCNTPESSAVCDSNVAKLLNSNIYLMVSYAQGAGTTLAAQIKTDTGIDVTAESMSQIFQKPDNVTALIKFLNDNYADGTLEPWPYCPGVKDDRCAACDPSAQVTDLAYVDDERLAPNQTLTCIQNTTILEGLIDLSTGLGIKIFDALSDSVSAGCGSLSNGWGILVVIIVVVVLIVVSVWLQMRKNKKAVVSIETKQQRPSTSTTTTTT